MTNDVNPEVMRNMIEEQAEIIENAQDMKDFFEYMLKDAEYWKRWEERNK